MEELSEAEIQALTATKERSPKWKWYQEFYQAAQSSQTHAVYCERLYGKNLCQQGFMSMQDLNKLLEVTCLDEKSQVLDMGCGNGMISEYISDQTGARMTGIDYIPEAIEQAQTRTQAKRERLSFQVMNWDHLDFPEATFDAILSIDSMYAPNNLPETIRQMKAVLKPGGQMAIFYSHALFKEEDCQPERLLPDATPLAEGLKKHALKFQTWDFTHQDYLHALRKKKIAHRLKEKFEAEGNNFLYEIRVAEAEGVRKAIHSGKHVRYLYRVTH